MRRYVLLISCADRPGLIHEVSGVLGKRGANILENHEFVDKVEKRFYMRTQFEGEIHRDEVIKELTHFLPGLQMCEIKDSRVKNLVLFVSREPHCLSDLLARHATGELRANVLAVISQVPDWGALVEKFGLPFHCIPIDGQSREQHEQRILAQLRSYAPDLIVLARYMRVFSADFVANFPHQIVNIHHSFLPAFIGRDPYEQAYARGVKIIGATAHYVTTDLDEGPIICQRVIDVDHASDSAEMARKGRDVERLTLAYGLGLVLEDRVIPAGERTVVFD